MRQKMSKIIREDIINKKYKTDYYSFLGIAEGPKKRDASEQAEEILKEIMNRTHISIYKFTL